MRIARFSAGEEPRYGVVQVVDGRETVAGLVGDPLFQGVEPTGQRWALDEVRLLAPVIPRSKAVCVGRNYADHASELGNDVPDEPLLFLKPNTSVVGPGEPIVHPPQSRDVQFEGELAAVIGRICRDVPPERVEEVVYGYTIANDVTARDLQRADVQFTRAKGFDSFCPLGPWIETDLDARDLALTTTLNGEARQRARTSQMVFDVAAIVSHVTSVMTLLPGDVVLTGTPAGVGRMEPGDEVSVSIEGIGTLTNPVVAGG